MFLFHYYILTQCVFPSCFLNLSFSRTFMNYTLPFSPFFTLINHVLIPYSFCCVLSPCIFQRHGLVWVVNTALINGAGNTEPINAPLSQGCPTVCHQPTPLHPASQPPIPYVRPSFLPYILSLCSHILPSISRICLSIFLSIPCFCLSSVLANFFPCMCVPFFYIRHPRLTSNLSPLTIKHNELVPFPLSFLDGQTFASPPLSILSLTIQY